MQLRTFFLPLSLALVAACSGGNDKDKPSPEPNEDPEPNPDPSNSGELTDEPCEVDRDCTDGAFCNGEEFCDDGFCRLGISPICDDGIECTRDRCSHTENRCQYEAPDKDGDGHQDAACEGPDGEALGDDCDDEDGDRYPGNVERCTQAEPDHDEDCDPQTFGHLDADLDGYVANACCNEGENGDPICGPDCDDADYSRYPDHPEICDDIDNNCDDEVDVNAQEVLWYPDKDGDHFGASSDDAILSCAPVDDHSLRNSDCDDTTAAVHPAAVEVCDGVDNDCDGDVDEDGVCACAPEGNARACACAEGGTGVQACVGGLWNRCDCAECVTGQMDCLGELLPRECVNGRWVVQPVCRGTRPICLTGRCVCADGTEDCEEVADVIPPVFITSVPVANAEVASGELNLIAAAFTEIVKAPANGDPAITVKNALGSEVSGQVAIGGSTVTFTPDASLPAGMIYEIQIDEGVTDIAGNAVGELRTISFSTELDVDVAPLSADPTVEHSSPLLDVSPGGEAILLASELSGVGVGLPTAEGVFAFHFNGAAWVKGDTFMSNDEAQAVAVDDRGQAGAQRGVGSDIEIYRFNGTDWSDTPPLLEGFHTPAGLRSTSDGWLLSVTSDTSTARIDVRRPDGTYELPVEIDSSLFEFPLGFRTAINDTGHTAISYIDNSGLGIFQASAGFSSWTSPTNVVTNALGTIHDSAVTVSKDGTGIFAYTQDLTDGLQDFSQILVSDVPSGSTWTGPGETPGGYQRRNAQDPRVCVFDNGDVILLYTSEGRQVIVTRRVGGNWEPEQEISVVFGGDNIRSPQLKVAPSGTAKVIWLQSQGPNFDLWGASYTIADGWNTQKLVDANKGGSVAAATLDVDDTGAAHVVFQRAGLHTFRF